MLIYSYKVVKTNKFDQKLNVTVVCKASTARHSGLTAKGDVGRRSCWNPMTLYVILFCRIPEFPSYEPSYYRDTKMQKPRASTIGSSFSLENSQGGKECKEEERNTPVLLETFPPWLKQTHPGPSTIPKKNRALVIKGFYKYM